MGDDPRNRSNPAEPAGADGPPVDEQVKDFAGSFDVPLTMLGTSPSGKQRVVTENLPPAVTAALPEANPEPLPAATPPEVSSAPSGFGEGVPNTMMAVEAAGLTKTLPKPAIPAAIGVVVGLALGLSGVTLAVCLLQFAMPTAVTPVALAMEFGSDPEFVTGVIFVTTLASVVSLTILLAFIR